MVGLVSQWELQSNYKKMMKQLGEQWLLWLWEQLPLPLLG